MINSCLPCQLLDCSLVAVMDTYHLQRNMILFESWQISLLPKGGIGKSYKGTPVISASCYSVNQASSYGFTVQWLVRAMAPIIVNITILNSIT